MHSRRQTRTLFGDELVQLLEVARGTPGCRVASVTEEMDIHLRNLGSFGSLKESEKVVDMRVDTTIGDLSPVQRSSDIMRVDVTKRMKE